MRKKIFFFLILLSWGISSFSQQIKLNGSWETGSNRQYNRWVQIPSISEDPTQMQKGSLWFRKKIELPKGKWTKASLHLKGARFAPKIYINGDFVSAQEGGLAPTLHQLNHPDVKGGNEILLEIELKSLEDLKDSDASYIPKADHWRSNISSCIWDDVLLHLHGELSIQRVIPFMNQEEKKAQLKVELNDVPFREVKAELCIKDQKGKSILKKKYKLSKSSSLLDFELDQLQKWTPEHPHLYTARLTIRDKKKQQDEIFFSIANRKFEVRNKQFFLNDTPCKLRAGTVVWHRWMRDQEGRELGYDKDWFYKNVIKRLKDQGANTLRYHLGNPPERFLSMCDKYGLLVQYEWSFFHGMPASKESLVKQWRNWLDLAMKHPSVVLIHPYNETHGKQLETAWEAIDEILPEYPKLVLADKDVIHIHKYWWSLFENLGLYYDSFDQFPKAIMVDEFGGNYLDGKGDVGGYKTTQSAFLRFLGKNHSQEERLKHHSESNAKVAEYWRRIDAAGVSPFCILGSHMDGDHWYMGELKNGNPKPVWKALTAAWSPISLSLDTWDRNYQREEQKKIPLHLFNDTNKKTNASITFGIKKGDQILSSQSISTEIAAYSHQIDSITITSPDQAGNYSIFAQLETPDQKENYPVISSWDIRVLELNVPQILQEKNIQTFEQETELNQFLKEIAIKGSGNKADVLIGAVNTWQQIEKNDAAFLAQIEKKIKEGTSVILLDIGPRFYGQANLGNDLGPLQGKYRVKQGKESQVNLPFGVQIDFKEISEPESHIHPAENKSLWKNLPKDANWLWNGRRGGLVVPATAMKISGLSQKAFLELWKTRGADVRKVTNDSYFAYNLQGFYAFAASKKDKKVQKNLREKVKFLVEDAPSLQNAINPNAKIEIINLKEEYLKSAKGSAEELVPLAVCGGSHEKIPVIMIKFGENKGKLILSQLLSNDRIFNPKNSKGTYEIRQDEAARQTLVNMIELLLQETKKLNISHESGSFQK